MFAAIFAHSALEHEHVKGHGGSHDDSHPCSSIITELHAKWCGANVYKKAVSITIVISFHVQSLSARL